MTFEDIALHVPSILLPREDIDLTKWAVIACDQYTSLPEYWEQVEALTAGSPSTAHLIFPEVYLESGDEEDRIRKINRNMAEYLEQGILVPQAPGFMLLDRKTCAVTSRKGLVVALDLEHYDFRSGADTLIRATEGTIVDRLPPRIRVRESAPIELPHIMVLIDDPDRTVIEPLFDLELESAYDFSLMLDGGHLRGWKVTDPGVIANIATALRRLADPAGFRNRYGVDGSPMLYAMGDGNHSFATAKAIWEKVKADADDRSEVMNHPARYALVELVNLHDEGLEFEPIFRVLFQVDLRDLSQAMTVFFEECDFTWRLFESREKMTEALRQAESQQGHVLPFVAGGRFGMAVVNRPRHNLAVGTLQSFLDVYLEQNPKTRIDYIHGDDAVMEFGSREDAMGFYLPSISKNDFFRTIILDGALPRKTFSMGHADEKRFYVECRRIIP